MQQHATESENEIQSLIDFCYACCLFSLCISVLLFVLCVCSPSQHNHTTPQHESTMKIEWTDSLSSTLEHQTCFPFSFLHFICFVCFSFQSIVPFSDLPLPDRDILLFTFVSLFSLLSLPFSLFHFFSCRTRSPHHALERPSHRSFHFLFRFFVQLFLAIFAVLLYPRILLLLLLHEERRFSPLLSFFSFLSLLSLTSRKEARALFHVQVDSLLITHHVIDLDPPPSSASSFDRYRSSSHVFSLVSTYI